MVTPESSGSLIRNPSPPVTIYTRLAVNAIIKQDKENSKLLSSILSDTQLKPASLKPAQARFPFPRVPGFLTASTFAESIYSSEQSVVMGKRTDNKPTSELAANNPPISASKQNRILIWRDEVATAVNPPPRSSLSSPQGISSAPSSSTVSTKSSSFSRRSIILARGKHLVSSVARRLSFRSSTSYDKYNPGMRTEMYTTLRPDYNHDNLYGQHSQVAIDDENMSPPRDESIQSGPRDAALREKQERLQRAARLLDQGADHHR